MKKKEVSSLTRRLLPYLPGFAAKADLLFVSPITHTLRGVLVAPSNETRSFYAHAFVQPLFVPAEHLALNLGWRITGSSSQSWGIDSPGLIDQLGTALQREALPLLLRVQSPDDVVAAAHELHRTADGTVQQMIAYALAKAGRVAEAVAALRRYASMLDLGIDWQRRSAERAEKLTEALLFDPNEAQAMLVRWEEETASRLTIAARRSSSASGGSIVG